MCHSLVCITLKYCSKNQAVAVLLDGNRFRYCVVVVAAVAVAAAIAVVAITINVRKLLKLGITMNNGVVHLWLATLRINTKMQLHYGSIR